MTKEELEKYQKIASQVAAWMSILAIFLMPYGYYIVLRWVVSIAALLTAAVAYKNHKTAYVVMAVIALILWNPITPVYLGREIWLPFNIVAAAFFFMAPKKIYE